MDWWFIYHSVLRIIGITIVLAVLALIIGAVLDEVKPGNWFTRTLHTVTDTVAALVFFASCLTLVALILFWLLYPLTPDYAHHDKAQPGCTAVGFDDSQGHGTTWVTPDRC